VIKKHLQEIVPFGEKHLQDVVYLMINISC